MQIGVPTVSAIAFFRVADKLRCHRATERVIVPAHWVTVHGHRVHRRAHAKTKRVTKCHPRTVLKRRLVSVKVRRHGRIARVKRVKLVRVVLLPHVVGQLTRRVGHGKTTTVSGWLGTYNGVALGGQTVEVLTAPDDGQDAFTPTTTATTASNGSWTATLPAGPSRLVEAEYAGGGDAQGSVSGTVTEIVPAKVELLKITPRRVPWGGTIRIVGRLRGGYLPAGGALVRLRIGAGFGIHDLRRARARHRKRAVHDHVYVRIGRARGLSQVLVPGRIAADRRLPVRGGEQPEGVRHRGWSSHQRTTSAAPAPDSSPVTTARATAASGTTARADG